MRREKVRWKRDMTCACDQHLRLEPCMCVHMHESVRSTQWERWACNKCVCVCVYTSRCTHSSCSYVVGTTPAAQKPKTKNHHSMTILREYPQTSFKFFLVSHQDWVNDFAFYQFLDVWVNASRFPEACSCSDYQWCLCVEFLIWVQVHRQKIFPFVWERLYTHRRSPWECTPLLRILWNVM